MRFDHAQGVFGPQVVRLQPWQPIEIRIENTETECFTFNLRETFPVDDSKRSRFDGSFDDTVVIPLRFDPAVAAYEIEAVEKTNAPPECGRRLSEGKWTVRTLPITWAVGFTGAFLGDEVTDPVFFLEPGSRTETDGSATDGFFVRRRRDAEDSVNLGTAGMIHLFRANVVSKWRYWAPLSFGLGVTEGSDLRYYLGTSLKFGEQTFLTVGRAFGSSSRLPDKLGLGDFTTDAQALASLPTRNDDAWFVAVSYTFLSTGIESFLRKGIGVEKPTVPSGGGQGDSDDDAGGDDPQQVSLKLSAANESVPPGGTFKLVLTADPAAPAEDLTYRLTAVAGGDELASPLTAADRTYPKGQKVIEIDLETKSDASGEIEIGLQRPDGSTQKVTVQVTDP